MIRWFVKLWIKILSLLYPRLDEILLERFILLLFPGRNFGNLVKDEYFNRQIVFKAIKDKISRLEDFYVIALYYHEEGRVIIQAVRKEEVQRRLDRDVFERIFSDI